MAKELIALELIKTMIQNNRQVCLDEFEKVVIAYNAEGEPRGYHFFYTLPLRGHEMTTLMQHAIYRGIKEGELKVVLA